MASRRPAAAATVETAWQLALSQARYQAAARARYYHAGLISLRPVAAPGLGTLGVTARGTLLVDPTVACTWHTAGHLSGVLVHELLHLLLEHASRRQGREMGTWNVCADAECNAVVLAGGFTLPDGAITHASLGLPAGLRAEEIYNRLVAQRQQQQPDDQADQDQAGDDQDDQPSDSAEDEGQGAPPADEEDSTSAPTQPGTDGDPADQGEAQSGAEDSEAGEGSDAADGGQDGTGGQAPSEDAAASSDASGAAASAGEQPGWGGRCGSGAGGEALPGEAEADAQADGGHSDGSLERVRQVVAKQVAKHEAQHGIGSAPGGLGVWAGGKLAPPKIRWEAKLARLVRGSLAHRAGAVDLTYRRPSRRQAGCGYGPGHPIVRGLHAPTPRLIALVDSSGSMLDGSRFQRALAEVGGIARAVGATLDVWSADTEVTSRVTVRHPSDLARVQLGGGGGTLVAPALAEAVKSRPRPDAVLYLTDGEVCDYPPHAPAGVVVIWVLIGRGAYQRRPPWGATVEVDLG